MIIIKENQIIFSKTSLHINSNQQMCFECKHFMLNLIDKPFYEILKNQKKYHDFLFKKLHE